MHLSDPEFVADENERTRQLLFLVGMDSSGEDEAGFKFQLREPPEGFIEAAAWDAAELGLVTDDEEDTRFAHVYVPGGISLQAIMRASSMHRLCLFGFGDEHTVTTPTWVAAANLVEHTNDDMSVEHRRRLAMGPQEDAHQQSLAVSTLLARAFLCEARFPPGNVLGVNPHTSIVQIDNQLHCVRGL
jgi:hypothetical protein